jgi:hypothetical protein
MECREVKDLEVGFYRESRRKLGRSQRCKQCADDAARRAEHTPRGKARRNRLAKRYAQRYPDRVKARRKRYYEKCKADKERYAQILEDHRINHRLRAEREGRTVVRSLSTATRGPDRLPKLPSKPLADHIDSIIRRRQMGSDVSGAPDFGDASADSVCSQLGIAERTLRSWRTGEYKAVQFDVADRIIVALEIAWEDVWPSDVYPEVYGERAA